MISNYPFTFYLGNGTIKGKIGGSVPGRDKKPTFMFFNERH